MAGNDSSNEDVEDGTPCTMAFFFRAFFAIVAPILDCTDRVNWDDWFDLAEMQIEDARAMFAIPEKSDAAKTAGSVGPWEPGGISPFQLAAGQALAEREGREYDSHGATAR